jgi:hypothetical protein
MQYRLGDEENGDWVAQIGKLLDDLKRAAEGLLVPDASVDQRRLTDRLETSLLSVMSPSAKAELNGHSPP